MVGTLVKGTIVINAEAGRTLRKQRTELLMTHVLDCAGSFRAGDRVYVTFRQSDGGQYVIATGIVRCDEAVLRLLMNRSIEARNIPIEVDDPVIVDFAERRRCSHARFARRQGVLEFIESEEDTHGLAVKVKLRVEG